MCMMNEVEPFASTLSCVLKGLKNERDDNEAPIAHQPGNGSC